MGKFKTPLRYPGGKQKLTPFIEEVLTTNHIDENYCEPYCGGAGVAISLLFSNKVKHIHLNDVDRGIYAFWHSILNKTEKFCERIRTVSLTVDEWIKQREVFRNKKRQSLFNLGFAVFFLNRCNRSGVLSAGIIGGLNQDGNYKLDARFKRNELIKRIEAISVFKKKITISNLDAEYYIKNYIPNLSNNLLVYFDPPYYVKGKELYLNAYDHDDHVRISQCIQNQTDNNWILSYDGVPEIINLYKERKQFVYDLQYSAANTYKGKEVFVFGDNIKLPKSSSVESINKALEMNHEL